MSLNFTLRMKQKSLFSYFPTQWRLLYHILSMKSKHQFQEMCFLDDSSAVHGKMNAKWSFSSNYTDRQLMNGLGIDYTFIFISR